MPAAKTYQHQHRRAIAYAIAAFFVLTSTDTAVKSLTDEYNPTQIGFFRYCITLLVIMVLVSRQQGGMISALSTRRPIEHIIRGLFAALELMAFYVALGNLALPVAVSMVMIAPIIITLLGVLFLRERMRPSGWAGVAVGFAGMLMVVQPTSGVNSTLGTIAAMVSVVLWAIVQLQARRLSATESSYTILFYYAIAGVILLGATMPFVWHAPDQRFLLLMGLVGTGASIGQFCLVQAFRYGPLSLLAPFENSALIWASLWGWIFWGEVLNALAIAGVALIIAACIHVSRVAEH